MTLLAWLAAGAAVLHGQDRAQEDHPPSVTVQRDESAAPLLKVWLHLDADGKAEMQIQVDENPPLAREKFAQHRSLELSPNAGKHRIVVRLWDRAGVESRCESTFDERASFQEEPKEEARHSRAFDLEIRLLSGYAFHGIEADSMSAAGPRRIESDPMPLLRLELRDTVLEPLYLTLGGEAAFGRDLRALTGSVGVGAHLLEGDLLESRFSGNIEAAALFSRLDVETSDFGDFDMAIGARIAVELELDLSKSFALDVLVEYRYLKYAWTDRPLGGDTRADASGLALLLGISYRF